MRGWWENTGKNGNRCRHIKSLPVAEHFGFSAVKRDMRTNLFATSISLLSLMTAMTVLGVEELKPVDVKFMVRGYCLAGSRVDQQALGGFGKADNSPKKIESSELGKADAISLVAVPDEAAPFAKTYQGFRLLLLNRTKTEAPFAASDSRLSIVQEAQDANGKWLPVEYLPSSWCGNSYHKVFLPAGHYWEFTAPKYTGAVKTKLRFVLQGGKAPVYSNEFEGSINLQQFTVKQGHTPTNIMDSYNE